MLGELEGTIEPDQPFWSLTATADRSRLFAPSVEKHSILVVDAKSRMQLKSISEHWDNTGAVRIAP